MYHSTLGLRVMKKKTSTMNSAGFVRGGQGRPSFSKCPRHSEVGPEYAVCPVSGLGFEGEWVHDSRRSWGMLKVPQALRGRPGVRSMPCVRVQFFFCRVQWGVHEPTKVPQAFGSRYAVCPVSGYSGFFLGFSGIFTSHPKCPRHSEVGPEYAVCPA